MTGTSKPEAVTAEQALKALAYLDMRRGYGQLARETIRAYIESTRALEPSAADYEAWFRTQQGVAYDGAWAFGRAAWEAAKAAPQPSVSAAEGDARDAARYRWLRDKDQLIGEKSLAHKLASMASKCWDSQIDAAAAQQEGRPHVREG